MMMAGVVAEASQLRRAPIRPAPEKPWRWREGGNRKAGPPVHFRGKMDFACRGMMVMVMVDNRTYRRTGSGMVGDVRTIPDGEPVPGHATPAVRRNGVRWRAGRHAST